MTMLAYHNDQNIKNKYLARVHEHRLRDELIQRTGWENGKGCAVGCTLEAYDHSRYPIELGIPLHLAHLEDRLFELQTTEDALAWPERFLSAIQPGADLSRVWPEWAVWMLTDADHGVIRYAGKREDVRLAIQRVADLWRKGGTTEEFRAAHTSVYTADAAAAYAADAAAAYAAYAADADAAAAAYAAAYADDAAAAANDPAEIVTFLTSLLDMKEAG
jgi:hypothetical protein